jgi:hypothetical protein
VVVQSRNHRFVLGERIERNLHDLLEILRLQMRLAKDLQCLKVESYGFAARAIDEVGGWLRSSGGSTKASPR